MSRIGLVLGGGGLTGAAFHFGTLFALRMATGWEPDDSDVVVGTSSGAVVAALTRTGALSLETLVGEVPDEEELETALRQQIFRRTRPRGVGRWMRHGLLPGLRRPGIRFTLGSPAPYSTDGIADWVRRAGGDAARTWPDRPTIIVAYELEARRRVAFGTVDSPDVDLATAVAASAAVPLVFEPVQVEGRRYVDGGVGSGTSADLLLGHREPLDLVIVIAPMAATETREDGRFYEGIVDRLGEAALESEIDALKGAWPDVDVLVLRPDSTVLDAARPNPLDPGAALPAFLATLRSMGATLSGPEVWPILERHIPSAAAHSPWDGRVAAPRIGKR